MASTSRSMLVIALAVGGLVSIAQGEMFECAFIQEKYASGKPNVATCSMLPEAVFSSKGYTPRRSEHCNVKPVYLFEDLTDVLISTEKGVFWTRHMGLTEDAKPRQKAYIVKNEGLSEEEAERRVQFERKDRAFYRIVAYLKSNTRIYFDEVTQKVLDPPKEVPAHNLILENGTSIYIPEASGHAILMEPTSTLSESWVTVRFGKCRKAE